MQYGVIVLHGEFGPEYGKLINHQPVAAFTYNQELEALTVEQALENAFRHTQNIHDSWSIKNIDHADGHNSMILLKPLFRDEIGELGHRSSMVGDLMLVSAENMKPALYRVADFGFDLISELS